MNKDACMPPIPISFRIPDSQIQPDHEQSQVIQRSTTPEVFDIHTAWFDQRSRATDATHAHLAASHRLLLAHETRRSARGCKRGAFARRQLEVCRVSRFSRARKENRKERSRKVKRLREKELVGKTKRK
jgi:hypothetical protein